MEGATTRPHGAPAGRGGLGGARRAPGGQRARPRVEAGVPNLGALLVPAAPGTQISSSTPGAPHPAPARARPAPVRGLFVGAGPRRRSRAWSGVRGARGRPDGGAGRGPGRGQPGEGGGSALPTAGAAGGHPPPPPRSARPRAPSPRAPGPGTEAARRRFEPRGRAGKKPVGPRQRRESLPRFSRLLVKVAGAVYSKSGIMFATVRRNCLQTCLRPRRPGFHERERLMHSHTLNILNA